MIGRVDGDIAVVIGASGGIGRALFDALGIDQRYGHVVGLSRRRPPDVIDDDRRTWLAADVLKAATLQAAAARVEALGTPTRVIVATGALHGPALSPEKSLRVVNSDTLAQAFEANAIGPALVAQHFLPMMPRDRAAAFAALSARVGSIGDTASA